MNLGIEKKEEKVVEEVVNNLNFKLLTKVTNENRYRVQLKSPYGTIYNFSVKKNTENCSWENAHFHKSLKEIYFVESGKILIATKGFLGHIRVKILNAGEALIVNEGVWHNVYVFSNTTYQITKGGEKAGNPDTGTNSDWWPTPKWFDDTTKSINPTKYN
jgi:mannose-6-phosphate isomerase-like protein (cupin superfamily)